MNIAEIMNNLIPIYLMFFLGFILKRLKVITIKEAKSFFLLIFNVLTPAMFLYSVPKVHLQLSFLKFPLFSIGMHFFMLVTGNLMYEHWKLKIDKVQFISSLMIINLGFTLPFYVSKYGYESIWQFSLFDLGNALIVFSFVQYFFVRNKVSLKTFNIAGVLKIIKSPPIVGIAIGLIINVSGIVYPKPLDTFLYKLVVLNSTLTMLGLGVYFTPKLKDIKNSLIIILLKMFLGMSFTLVCNHLFSFELSAKTLIFLIGTSPLGVNIITFSVIYKKEEDVEFASGVVSLSMIIGMVISSLVLIFV